VVTIGLSGAIRLETRSNHRATDFRRVLHAGVRMGTFDPLTVDDVRVVREQVPSIVAASRFLPHDASASANGKRQDILVLGAFPEYKIVRSICKFSRALFRRTRRTSAQQSGVVTEKLAQKLYGSTEGRSARDKSSASPSRSYGTFKEADNVRAI